jgi:hypothetical protein
LRPGSNFFDTPSNFLGRYLISAFFRTPFNKNGIPGNIKKIAGFYFCYLKKNTENESVMSETRSFRKIKKIKLTQLLLFALISAIFLLLLLLINGCKIDVAEPIRDKPFTKLQTPKITNVVPAKLIACVNIITISREVFTGEPGTNV